MFKSREAAGKLLGDKVREEIQNIKEEVVVLAIPRGGAVVAKEIAEKLGRPLDVLVVRKIGAPGNKELAIGAIGETRGAKFLDERLMADLEVDKSFLEKEIEVEKLEIKRREKTYRQARKPLSLDNKTIILVDDGAATGATVIAAAREVWNNNPKRVIIALPVVAKDTLERIEKEADEVVYLEAPETFFSVGQFYEEFKAVSDEEVINCLR
jgi:putative phosphoribosyl transferase